MTPIEALGRYVEDQTERGTCRCGQCIDRPAQERQPNHGVSVHFFDVALKDWHDPDLSVERFRALTAAAQQGEFNACDPFDGQEHGFIELGGWLGDQGLALQYMGLGSLLEQFQMLTPERILGTDVPQDLLDNAAGQGLVTIVAKKDDHET